MTTKPIFGSGTIKIGTTASPTDQFECVISQFVVSASPSSITIPATYCEAESTAATGSSFSVSWNFAQDWGATPSLSELLLAQDGNLLYWAFEPDDVTVGSFTGQCYGVAGDIGGPGQGLWVSTGQLPCPEAPVYTPPV